MLFFYAATVSFTERLVDRDIALGEEQSSIDGIVPSKNEDDDDDDDWESLLVAVTSLLAAVVIIFFFSSRMMGSCWNVRPPTEYAKQELLLESSVESKTQGLKSNSGAVPL